MNLLPQRRRASSVWGLLLVGVFIGPSASAHYPHDVAYWVAISPDPDLPKLATSLERIDLDLLGRSENGLDWASRLVQAVPDGQVVSGIFLTPDRLVLATGQPGLRRSEDAGDSFVDVESVTDPMINRLVASPDVLEDGVAFAAGTDAVWRTMDAGLSWEPVQEASDNGFFDIDLSPEYASDGRVCAAERNTLSCSADRGEHWEQVTLPERTYRISVGAGQRLWAVVRDEGLFRSRDDGESWSLAAFADEDVTAIAELSDDLVLLSTARQAEQRSTDGGETWAFVDVLRVSADQGRDGVNFFDFLEGPDGAVYLACWSGLARSEDRGQTYTFYNTERPENTHSVVLSEGSGERLIAWLGSYGSGPILVDVGSLTARAYPSLLTRFTRNTLITRRWEEDGVAIFDEGYSTFRSTDYGASWVEIASNPIEDGDVTLEEDVKGIALSPEPQTDPFLIATVGSTAMSFQTSEDLGDTWSTGSQDPVCTRDGFAVALSPRWPSESRAWAACGGAVYESVDRGQSWSVIGDTGASFIFGFAQKLDGSLLVATSDGLWKVDGGATTSIGFNAAVVVSVATSTEAGDDTVFVLLPREGWKRSDDGGQHWLQLAAPTAEVPRMVSMSPTFAEDGSVAVAGYGGAWLSTDRGETWSSIYALEVFEGGLDAWRSTGAWESALQSDASGQEVVWSDDVGASRTLDFQGVAIALEVPTHAEAGVLAISLDGAPPEERSLPAGGPTLWSAEGLSEGWHSLRVEVVLGRVTLDDARVTRLGMRDPGEASEKGSGRPADGRCACAGGSRGALLLMLPLALRRRRWWRSPSGRGPTDPAPRGPGPPWASRTSPPSSRRAGSPHAPVGRGDGPR